MAAAQLQVDGDSLHNAGFCLEHGLGTTQDLKAAADLYRIAARKFGHFDSAKSLGMMYMAARGVARDPVEAMVYLSAANNVGPWAGWLRRGLDQYLEDAFAKSLMCYLRAGEVGEGSAGRLILAHLMGSLVTGYEVSQSNAAFIVRRKIKLSKQLGWMDYSKSIGSAGGRDVFEATSSASKSLTPSQSAPRGGTFSILLMAS